MATQALIQQFLDACEIKAHFLALNDPQVAELLPVISQEVVRRRRGFKPFSIALAAKDSSVAQARPQNIRNEAIRQIIQIADLLEIRR